MAKQLFDIFESFFRLTSTEYKRQKSPKQPKTSAKFVKHGIIFQDSDEAGPLEKLRSQICDNVALYAQKYDEEFQVS